MFRKLTEAEMRQVCKEHIESLETWLRRLINEKLAAAYGRDYFNAIKNGRKVIKKEISANGTERLTKEPSRYPRPVDAL